MGAESAESIEPILGDLCRQPSIGDMAMAQLFRILAFGGALLAGVLCVVFAIMYQKPALFVWAVAAFFGGVTGFLFAGKAKPDGSLSGPKVAASSWSFRAGWSRSISR